MGETAKNLITVLGLITIVIGAYYLFVQYQSAQSNSMNNEVQIQDDLNKANAFIQKRQALDGIELDFAVLSNDNFNNLRSFTTPIEEVEKGRDNPFSDVGNNF
tara:strand:- start:725 stop:1033 length:309 start_codon:yes stop_codon:yes gene_type:complete